MLLREQSGVAAFMTSSASLQDRPLLLREINLACQEKRPVGQVFLVVINMADTNNYDEIISIFGYKLADDLLNIRLADIEFLSARQPTYRVGFWSVGLVFRAQNTPEYQAALEKLIRVLAKPVICRGIPVGIRAGVGICDLMKSTGAAEDLLQAAYLAGQVGAKSAAGWAECNYDLTTGHQRAFTLIADAENSLATAHEFSLRYQARIDLKTGRANAVETFLRWRHPTLGMVMPDEFIPLIEMTGLMRELTNWVLANALAQLASWHSLGFKLRISVKISPKNLEEVDFVLRLEELLKTHGIAPSFLELEFSERHKFTDMELTRTRLRELRQMGVSVSIDDFGTGINSLSSLENLPVSALKLDRRLVHSVVDNARQQALVKALIHMAHELDIYVVAEGVENQAMLEMLLAWRCDFAEGYLINRPMPAEAFIEWFTHRFPSK